MCSKLTIATIELHQLTSGNSTATIEHIWHINLGFLVYKFEKLFASLETVAQILASNIKRF